MRATCGSVLNVTIGAHGAAKHTAIPSGNSLTQWWSMTSARASASGGPLPVPWLVAVTKKVPWREMAARLVAEQMFELLAGKWTERVPLLAAKWKREWIGGDEGSMEDMYIGRRITVLRRTRNGLP